MSAPLAALCGLWSGSSLLQRILEEGSCAVADVARAFTLAGLSAESSPLLVVLPRSRDAEVFADDLRQYLTSSDVVLYPAWEVLPGEAMSPTLSTMGMRIRVIRDLRGGAGARVIVTSIRALLQRVSPGPIESIALEVGGSWSLDLLAEKLTGFGYERNYLVERPGEFSIRGGILDVFPADGVEPVRADMFGDEIAELRSFGVSSQRSREPVETVEILPCRELLLTDEVREKAATLTEKVKDQDTSSALSKIASGVLFPGMEAYLPIVSEDLVTISSLLPSEGSVVILDPKQARDRAADFLSQATQWGGTVAAGHFVEFEEATSDVRTVEVWPYARGEEDPQVDVTGWDGFLGRVDDLAAELRGVHASGASLVVAAGRSSPRAREVLAQGGLGLAEGPAAIGKAMLTDAHVMRGFKMMHGGIHLAIVGESDLFGKRRPVVASRAETPARASALLLELASEDYVVHETYGVGMYHGMVTRDIGGVTRDYLIIEYHGDDRLYLPTEQLEAITRYTGGETPRLNRLGTAEWEKAKGRARKAVADIAGELIVLYSKRLNSPGHAFALDTPWQRELEDSFIHVETPDQSRTIDEVKADMERPIPMDRL
ncbi:MAG TPA: CarD family transcriptional regulator, partial [Actinomycetota bacterium]|nr:CarD family transcriptional regulator [Actinomycetota bacterium]